ncbi:unnamed protein product [Nyctereutes procyonoides]|uniref:(raccoon dog) hypothetical protein n=1 Tax=Nyctereutes procyonoides TaxID=34880 RepID=A0A812A0K1_NYCPR|nr:unnamed protein product [Nyctereutes procyonoides]
MGRCTAPGSAPRAAGKAPRRWPPTADCSGRGEREKSVCGARRTPPHARPLRRPPQTPPRRSFDLKLSLGAPSPPPPSPPPPLPPGKLAARRRRHLAPAARWPGGRPCAALPASLGLGPDTAAPAPCPPAPGPPPPAPLCGRLGPARSRLPAPGSPPPAEGRVPSRPPFPPPPPSAPQTLLPLWLFFITSGSGGLELLAGGPRQGAVRRGLAAAPRCPGQEAGGRVSFSSLYSGQTGSLDPENLLHLLESTAGIWADKLRKPWPRAPKPGLLQAGRLLWQDKLVVRSIKPTNSQTF